MSSAPTRSEVYRPWLHRWAVLTTLAILPLVSLGGLVTSLRVGMVDPQPVRVPWYMLTLAWEDTAEAHGIGFLVEHGHRQLGWIVGLMTMVLTCWVLARSGSSLLRWLAVAALLGVAFQGVLGMLRVYLNAAGWGLEFAMIHGISGQLVFVLTATLALMTCRSWIEPEVVQFEGGAKFRRLCRLTTIFLLVQLVVGVWLRQMGQGPSAAILIVHAILALAILAHVVMLFVRVRRFPLATVSSVRFTGWTMAVLVLAQVGVGIAAWLSGSGQGSLDFRPVSAARAVLPTVHVLVGALLLVFSWFLTMRAYRNVTVEQTKEPMLDRAEVMA